jgi:2'-phosphotransferase
MSCQVFVEVDLPRAMHDGIVFYISKNNVILSSGIDGMIPASYFKLVKDLKGAILLDNI